eukprot:TRINITY_DN5656_c0_g1_i2.p1 TRINITY_DN5656_c0_g1~~TRINITY_DN5656_c0_g1_i2.p1  ORF type:complete len:351 (-),score=61.63 TRINITY_DN5656_c0_g1_i2:366-1364(-)
MVTGRPPFDAANCTVPELHQQMHLEAYPREGDRWDAISANAQDFVPRLLRSHPSSRLDLDDILEHPWLNDSAAMARDVEESVYSRIMSDVWRFAGTSHFFSVCRASLAQQLRHKDLEDLFLVFCELDIDGDGVLSMFEFKRAFRGLFCSSEAELEKMFARLDLDGSGCIDYTEFCAAGLGDHRRDEDELWAAFKAFDTCGKGEVSKEELAGVLRCGDVGSMWSEEVCEQVAGEVLSKYGSDEGNINFVEWQELMDCCSRRHQERVPAPTIHPTLLESRRQRADSGRRFSEGSAEGKQSATTARHRQRHPGRQDRSKMSPSSTQTCWGACSIM